MKNKTYLAGLALSSLLAGASSAAVLMSDAGTTAPSAGGAGISQTDSSGDGAGVNDYSDGGGLGQSFTLATGFTYDVNAFSLMFDGDANGGVFGDTWNVQITRYDNDESGGFSQRINGTSDGPEGGNASAQFINNPLGTDNQQFMDIATIAEPDVGDWVTISFTGDDVLTLEGGYTYAIQLTSDSGWSRWAVGDGDTVADAERFRAYGGANFNDNYVQASSDNDRTFVLDLTATAIPEPSAALLGGLGLLGLLRRRRN